MGLEHQTASPIRLWCFQFFPFTWALLLEKIPLPLPGRQSLHRHFSAIVHTEKSLALPLFFNESPSQSSLLSGNTMENGKKNEKREANAGERFNGKKAKNLWRNIKKAPRFRYFASPSSSSRLLPFLSHSSVHVSGKFFFPESQT